MTRRSGTLDCNLNRSGIVLPKKQIVARSLSVCAKCCSAGAHKEQSNEVNGWDTQACSDFRTRCIFPSVPLSIWQQYCREFSASPFRRMDVSFDIKLGG